MAKASDGDGPQSPQGTEQSTPTSEQSFEGDGTLRIPREVIEKLKYTVFGFDTFWVTSVENYEQDGVVFKGNVRGRDPAQSYQKMCDRLKEQLGDQYTLFLLIDREDKPTVALLPKGAGSERISRFTENWVAATFALFTLLSTLNANNVPIIQWLLYPFNTELTRMDFMEALPSTLAFTAILVAHEVGHWRERHDAEMYLPFIVPAGFGFLGSFGGITRLKGFLPDRDALLKFGTAGPLYGSSVSLGLFFIGMVLSSLGVVDIGVDSPAFTDSLLVAVSAQAFLGDQLLEPIVQVNSLMLAGWAGLLVNALACIPAGETDGGRIATAIWGRRGGTALGIWSVGLLTITSLSSALAFFWLVLVLVTQRGPVLPCRQEITDPRDESAIQRGLVMLGLPLLILLPYPAELIRAAQDLANPAFF